MKPTKHIALSGAVGAGIYWWTQSWPAALACLAAGVLIDLDHFLDFYLARGRLPVSYDDLVRYGDLDKKGKLYLVLHGYEQMVVLWLCIYYFHLDAVWVGAALSMSVHLLCDQIANPFRVMGYFFTYRWYNRFERRRIFTPAYLQQYFDSLEF